MARAEASAAAPAWRSFTIDTARLPPARHAIEVEIAPSGPLPRGVCVDLVALP
jgi:streptogramin lyase